MHRRPRMHAEARPPSPSHSSSSSPSSSLLRSNGQGPPDLLCEPISDPRVVCAGLLIVFGSVVVVVFRRNCLPSSC
eukprot:8371948-Pyramimonas_sp.AAC.1